MEDSKKTYFIMEVVGTSTKNFHDAIQNGIDEAYKQVKHIRWFEMVSKRGHIQDGKIVYYQATLKLGYSD